MPLSKLRIGRDLGGVALAGALLLSGCGGDDGDAPDRPAPALHGSALVAGSAVEEWGLLVLPRDGGPAELRPLDDLSRRVWTGSTPLPASVEAHPLGGGSVVLRTADGTVHRYDPAADALAEVGEVGGEASWHAAEGAGAWTDPAGMSVLVVTGSDAWRVRVPATPLWAAPAGEGAVAAIVGTPESARLLLVGREGEPIEPSPDPGAESSGPDALRPPAVVTAWGRRIATTGADGRSLVVLSVPDLEPLATVEFDEPITALAASPSSHAFYVALGAGPTRIVSHGRLRDEAERLARIDEAVRRIRPSLMGAYLLADAGESGVLVPLDGGEPARLSGRWRPDLPLGLPGTSVLVWTGSEVALWSPGDGEAGASRPVEDAPDGWWLPVRWRPPSPTRVAEDDAPPEGAAPETPPVASAEAGEDASGEPAAETAAERPEAPARATSTDGGVGETALDPGFYAIVSSSQQADAIAALAGRLDEAGFRARVQRHRDEASEVWYRAMVGPYDSRPEAEAAARQLRRERGLQAWIAEVGPDVRSDDVPG